MGRGEAFRGHLVFQYIGNNDYFFHLLAFSTFLLSAAPTPVSLLTPVRGILPTAAVPMTYAA